MATAMVLCQNRACIGDVSQILTYIYSSGMYEQDIKSP